MSITSQVIILFLVVLVGLLCRRLGYFTDETIRGVTQIVINVAVPALTISSMQRPFAYDVLLDFLLTLALTTLLVTGALAAGMLIFRGRPHARRATAANLITFANCGFMGYPIILAINPDWMIYAVSYNIANIFVTWTLGVSLYQGKENVSLRRVLLNPNILSALVGFLLFCTGVTLPTIPGEALAMLGGLTTPMTMLLLGTRLDGLHLADLKEKDYHIIAGISLLAFPLFVRMATQLLPLNPVVADTMFILAAMPCGTLNAMQAELYGGDNVFAARVIAYATLLSLITVPLLSMLL